MSKKYLVSPEKRHGDIFKEYLKRIATELEPELVKRLEELEIEMTEVSPIIGDLAKEFTKANAGGKRVRGGLVELGYEMIAGERSPAMKQVAIAYEIMQTSILAHDDIIDKSELRRGIPTLYQSIGNDHRGISHGIILADIGYFYSFRLLSELSIDDGASLRGMRWFGKAMQRTGIGQLFDIELPYVENKSEEDALTVYAWKTGWYTVTAPLCIGATYAGASAELLEKLIPFTQAAGIAFQIHDDILGIYGDIDITKKSASSDVTEGKHTVLSAYAKAVMGKEDYEEFTSLYGNESLDSEGVERVRELLVACGSLAHAQGLVLEFIEKAEAILEGITEISTENKAILRSMARFFIERAA